MNFPGEKVGDRDDVREVSKQPSGLVWVVGQDGTDGAFERYVVHCLARWYGLVSFSKQSITLEIIAKPFYVSF